MDDRAVEPAECLIITGMPAAGKSTVTRLVAARLERAARVDGDELGAMIISGGVWALGEPADEAARQVELCTRNVGALARNFAAAGFTAVIDRIVPDRRQLDQLLALLEPMPTRLVVLAPGSATCRARNATRDPDQAWEFPGYEALERSMRREFGDRGWWLASSGQTAEETAGAIIASRASGLGDLTGPAAR